jgi:hypothetical protein
MQEGQTIIIILYSQGGTHSGRQLIDKTKQAAVVAGSRPKILNHDARAVFLGQLHLEMPFEAIRAPGTKNHTSFGQIEPEGKFIGHIVTIYGQDLVPGQEADRFRGGTSFYFKNPDSLF